MKKVIYTKHGKLIVGPITAKIMKYFLNIYGVYIIVGIYTVNDMLLNGIQSLYNWKENLVECYTYQPLIIHSYGALHRFGKTNKQNLLLCSLRIMVNIDRLHRSDGGSIPSGSTIKPIVHGLTAYREGHAYA